MENQTECCICYESLSKEDKPFVCGHIVHMECAKKQFKAECPLCRTPVNITVSGTRPDTVIVGGITEEEEEYSGQGNVSRDREYYTDILEEPSQNFFYSVEPYHSTRNVDDPSLGDVNEVEFNHFFEREDFLPEFGRNKRRREDTPTPSLSEDSDSEDVQLSY